MTTVPDLLHQIGSHLADITDNLPRILTRIDAINWRTRRLNLLVAPYTPVVRLATNQAAANIYWALLESEKPFQRGAATTDGDT